MKRRGAGTITTEDVGSRVRLQAWVQRRRDHGGLLFLDLRDRSGVVQVVVHPDEQPRGRRGPGPGALRVGGRGRGRGRAAASREGQPRAADRRDRGGAPSAPSSSSRSEPPPFALDGKTEAAEETAAALPLPRPAPRPELQKNFLLRDRVTIAVRNYFHEHGLRRRRDADPHQVHAGGRARLPGAFARPPRQLLRPAAVAAAVQAAPDGGRLRALHPDRPLLPRRGPAGRPPARVHPGRRRDVLPHGGGHLRADRGALRAHLPARRHLSRRPRSRG